jgi:hypothetical protein
MAAGGTRLAACLTGNGWPDQRLRPAQKAPREGRKAPLSGRHGGHDHESRDGAHEPRTAWCRYDWMTTCWRAVALALARMQTARDPTAASAPHRMMGVSVFRPALRAAQRWCLIALVAGCGETKPPSTSGFATTGGSGGWILEETYRLGRVDAEGPEIFSRLADFAVCGDERLHVLEGHAREVRVFDRDGRHVRTLGRSGRGPGEFTFPAAVECLPNGGIMVVDIRNVRYTFFDTAGVLVREERRAVPWTSFPWRGGVDEHGQIYEWSFTGRDVLLRLDATFSPRDTLDLPLPQIDRLQRRTPAA